MADPYTHQISHLSNSTLSFSSTLLEEICRSIDQSTNDGEEVVVSMRKKRDTINLRPVFKTEQEQMANYQRACMIEKWMEKKVTEKVVVRAKSMADLKVSRKDRQGSSSSSSDSSCGFFSSSETESFPIPKPVRTGGGRNSEPAFMDQKKPKHESRLIVKTKSRALKMYGDLKKIKQPISPGGKVAAFLNSIFTGKKPMGDLNASTPSRSCLSKTTTPKAAGKRSVRFSSDEETLHNKNNDVGFIRSGVDEEVTRRIMERTRKVEEALMNYQKKLGKCGRELEEEENDLDAESCGSSDLFELDNLSAIGMEDEISLQYREELPVYETTNLDKIHTMQMG